MPLGVSGFFYRIVGGGPYIALNKKLEASKFLFVAFHELGHYLMHKRDKGLPFHSDGRTKNEVEADAFAYLATGLTRPKDRKVVG